MRGGRSDFVSAAVVLASVCGVAVVFPFKVTSFEASAGEQAKETFASFVQLSAEDEAAAMKAAKSSWNAESGAVRRMRAELFSGELPEASEEPVLALGDCPVRASVRVVSPSLSPYLPSLAAPPPEAIEPDKAAPYAVGVPAFSRDELLRID